MRDQEREWHTQSQREGTLRWGSHLAWLPHMEKEKQNGQLDGLP